MSEALPAGLVQRGQTRVFTAEDIPPALLQAHDLKPDRWGVLELFEGEVVFVDLDTNRQTRLKAPSSHLIAPSRPHHLQLTGPMACQITFYGRPEQP